MLEQFRKRGLFAAACLVALLLVTGCFQSAGESLQATSVAQGGATFTPTPSVTPTEAATEEVTEPVEEETEPPLDVFPFPEITETPEAGIFPQDVDEGDGIQQDASVPEQIEDPEMTATALIQRATERAALEMTMTAEAIATPVVPTIPPPEITPTVPIEVPTSPPPSGGTCVHVVQRGENLFRISLRYGTTVHVLQDLNGIANIHLILVGQQLVVPNCSGGPGGPNVPPPPPGGGRIHVVRQGENLFRISLTYGVPLASVLAANPQITNPNLIYIDQQIVIP